MLIAVLAVNEVGFTEYGKGNENSSSTTVRH
jgi:hypothetical protein